MWVVFLLSAISVAVCMLLIIYIANKVIMAIENDRRKNNKNKENNNES